VTTDKPRTMLLLCLLLLQSIKLCIVSSQIVATELAFHALSFSGDQTLSYVLLKMCSTQQFTWLNSMFDNHFTTKWQIYNQIVL
jgi:hypothetical protein